MFANLALGQIWRDENYYNKDGEWFPKYFVVLGFDKWTVTICTLTSRQHGRPETPACYHDITYPSYFLGIPDNGLSRPTWVDLRAPEDIDASQFDKMCATGDLTHILTLPEAVVCPLLACAAYAPHTSRVQEQRMKDARLVLGCR